MKSAYIFDLDGTLAESKQPMDDEMAGIVSQLLSRSKVAIISGGSYDQMYRSAVSRLPSGARLENLYLFPVSASAFYKYSGEAGAASGALAARNGWQEVYADRLPEADKAKIRSVILDAEAKLGFAIAKTYGDKIEDRGSQMTYSALGQSAPIEVKRAWDPDQEKRRAIVDLAAPFLTGYNLGIGGMTSIDVTRGGTDKGYGVRQIAKALTLPIESMMFIGDALDPGGNDYPARATGIECYEVKSVADTKAFIRRALAA
ncbi:MAG: HAD-IIB family hydrolase [Patescibacteria group bacterium]|nr:HAD-IIB family hydrolase [Patescibacteria group bacterium]MDE2116820.1 HAD-IIB family hydrolase [Patescibacteria group bacterium]